MDEPGIVCRKAWHPGALVGKVAAFARVITLLPYPYRATILRIGVATHPAITTHPGKDEIIRPVSVAGRVAHRQQLTAGTFPCTGRTSPCGMNDSIAIEVGNTGRHA